MRSFIRSYDSATLVKTPATRSLFSASVTVSKPKWVGREGSGRAYSGIEEEDELLVLGARDGTSEEKDRDDVDDDNDNLNSGVEYNTELEQRAALRRAGLTAETDIVAVEETCSYSG